MEVKYWYDAWGDGVVMGSRKWDFFLGDENVPELTVVINVQLCEYAKSHCIVRLKMVALYYMLMPKKC